MARDRTQIHFDSIFSTLQFQTADGQFPETDASGPCTATYTLHPQKMLKTKTDCVSRDLPYLKNPDDILGTRVQSLRRAEYEFDEGNSRLISARSKETHAMYLTAKEEIGSFVETTQVLDFLRSEPVETVAGKDLDAALEIISQAEGVTFTQESLLTEREPLALEDVVTFSKRVDQLRDHLKTQNMGTLKPAKAFLLLVQTGRGASKEDILKALESKKNKQIL